MPMIVSKKQRIYFAIEGERGPMLMLHHGLFGSHRDWYDWGFVAALVQDYRLIIPDARGHGRSDKPLESAQYTLELLAGDMIELLDDLDVRNVFFLGYSLGALVGLELAGRYSRRVRGAVLGGESPFVTGEAVAEWRGLAEKLAAQPIAAVAEALAAEQRLVLGRTPPSDDPEESPPARAMLEAMAGWEPHGSGRLPVRTPLALFEGEQEQARPVARKAHEALAQARLIILPGKTTVQAVAEREPLLKEAVAFFRASRRGQERGAEGAERERGRRGPSGQQSPAEPPPPEAPPAGPVESEPPAPQGAPTQADAAPGTEGSPERASAPATAPTGENRDAAPGTGVAEGEEAAAEGDTPDGLVDDDAYEREAVAYGEADDEEGADDDGPEEELGEDEEEDGRNGGTEGDGNGSPRQER